MAADIATTFRNGLCSRASFEVVQDHQARMQSKPVLEGYGAQRVAIVSRARCPNLSATACRYSRPSRTRQPVNVVRSPHFPCDIKDTRQLTARIFLKPERSVFSARVHTALRYAMGCIAKLWGQFASSRNLMLLSSNEMRPSFVEASEKA
jgi:hypothetical protein